MKVHDSAARVILSVNRELSDDVTCELVTLIQYLLTVAILVCGLTAARSARHRLSFLLPRARDNSTMRMKDVKNGSQNLRCLVCPPSCSP